MVFFPANTEADGRGFWVFLPVIGSPSDFYERLKGEYVAKYERRQVNTNASPLGWPTGPEFLLDFEERSHDHSELSEANKAELQSARDPVKAGESQADETASTAHGSTDGEAISE